MNNTRIFRRACGVLLCALALARPATLAEENAVSIRMTLADNLTVDAAVEATGGGSWSGGSVTVEPLRPDAERVRELLAGGAAISEEYIYPEDKDDPLRGEHRFIVFDDGASFSVNSTRINYHTELGSCVDQAMRLENILNDELASAELPFASRVEAEDTVLAALSALGIGNARLAEAYALPYGRMREVSEKIGNDAGLQLDVAEGRLPLKLDWTEKDDCYLMYFELEISGLTVDTNTYEVLGGGSIVQGSAIEVLLSATGVEELEAHGLYRIVFAGEAEALISPEEALNRLAHKYRNVILGDEMIVDRIALKYVPFVDAADAGRLQLLPAWCFRISATVEPEWHDPVWTCFDARNGAELY